MRRYLALSKGFDVSGPCLTVILLAVYAVSRALLLDVELTFEEPIWINQGVGFFETGRFTSYLSIELPDYSGFRTRSNHQNPAVRRL